MKNKISKLDLYSEDGKPISNNIIKIATTLNLLIEEHNKEEIPQKHYNSKDFNIESETTTDQPKKCIHGHELCPICINYEINNPKPKKWKPEERLKEILNELINAVKHEDIRVVPFGHFEEAKELLIKETIERIKQLLKGDKNKEELTLLGYIYSKALWVDTKDEEKLKEIKAWLKCQKKGFFNKLKELGV